MTARDGIIYFLDDKKYPHSELVISYLIASDLDIEILDYNKDKEELYEKLRTSSSSSYFTIVPEVHSEIKSNVPLARSFINAADEDQLMQVKEIIESQYPKLNINKLKLSTTDLDPLLLSKIFEESPSLSVKVQTKGIPMIHKYEGLVSFLTINEFSSGVVSPATQEESNSVFSVDPVPNHDYIYQRFQDKPSVFLRVTEREYNDLKWYDIEQLELPRELVGLDKDTSVKAAYFIYLRKLHTYKISAIFSGVNYHVNPRYYL